jgi:hypothetical protein
VNPEQHACMAAMFKKLNSEHGPPTVTMLPSRSAPPAVQAIIVDGVPIVNPQFTSIVRN